MRFFNWFMAFTSIIISVICLIKGFAGGLSYFAAGGGWLVVAIMLSLNLIQGRARQKLDQANERYREAAQKFINDLIEQQKENKNV